LLATVADRLGGRLRRGDTLARVGGDEFAVVLENLPEGPATATSVADALIAALRPPFLYGPELLTIGSSIGVALRPTDAATATRLMQCADSAMYAAKTAGGNVWARYESWGQGITARWRRLRDGPSLPDAG
jgi:diguanylate cyclase (GGDEF)-like protein